MPRLETWSWRAASSTSPDVPAPRPKARRRWQRILAKMYSLTRGAFGAALVVVIAAGCNGGNAPSPSGSLAPDASPTAITCPSNELRTPSGDLVDLTGTWFGVDDQTYYSFFQIGSCVWASSTGGPHVFDNARICCQELVLHGTVASDFTIAVDFAYVPLECEESLTPCVGAVGTATLKIEIESGPGGEVLTLHKVGGATGPDRPSNLGVTLWTRVPDDEMSPSPSPAT